MEAMRYREHLRQFVQEVKPDLISYDHYHFLKNSDGGQYFLNLALVRMAAQKAGVPFQNIIQTCDSPAEGWRGPGEHEIRWLNYTSLAYGAQAVAHFRYDIGYWSDPSNTATLRPLFWAVSQINRVTQGSAGPYPTPDLAVPAVSGTAAAGGVAAQVQGPGAASAVGLGGTSDGKLVSDVSKKDAFDLSTTKDLPKDGRLLVLRNKNTEKFMIDKDGKITSQSVTTAAIEDKAVTSAKLNPAARIAAPVKRRILFICCPLCPVNTRRRRRG
jgi:hypothetical protein